jgi:hypothetical protein
MEGRRQIQVQASQLDPIHGLERNPLTYLPDIEKICPQAVPSLGCPSGPQHVHPWNLGTHVTGRSIEVSEKRRLTAQLEHATCLVVFKVP